LIKRKRFSLPNPPSNNTYHPSGRRPRVISVQAQAFACGGSLWASLRNGQVSGTGSVAPNDLAAKRTKSGQALPVPNSGGLLLWVTKTDKLRRPSPPQRSQELRPLDSVRIFNGDQIIKLFIRGILALSAALVCAVVVALAFISSGLCDVTAVTPHTRLVGWPVHQVCQSSMERDSAGIEVPGNFYTAANVQTGAQFYGENCALCHSAPGEPLSPVGRGIYPSAPKLLAATRRTNRIRCSGS
jgi:hypothetical protein